MKIGQKEKNWKRSKKRKRTKKNEKEEEKNKEDWKRRGKEIREEVRDEEVSETRVSSRITETKFDKVARITLRKDEKVKFVLLEIKVKALVEEKMETKLR